MKTSSGPDLNQRPMDTCTCLYSPPLYQLSYQRISAERLQLDVENRCSSCGSAAWRHEVKVVTPEVGQGQASVSSSKDNLRCVSYHPLVAQLVERWTVEEITGIHRSLVQIRPGGHFNFKKEVKMKLHNSNPKRCDRVQNGGQT